jgi:anti-sigma-K factor RskA
MLIDEHVLAAYISGELTAEDRTSVTQRLIEDESLRNWLQMASMALSAAREEQEEGPSMRLLSTIEPGLPRVYSGDRKANPIDRSSRRAI